MNIFTGTTLFIFAAFTFYMGWAATKVKKVKKHQSYWDRGFHVAMLIASFLMSFVRFGNWSWLGFQSVPNTLAFGLMGVLVCATGMAFCFWARRTLGSNWSGTVTLKHDHELIQKGPYGLTRHPMYTGILTGLLGVDLTIGQIGNFLGIALLVFAFLRKIKLEEIYMTQHFGKRYLNYVKKVKRLVPFIY